VSYGIREIMARIEAERAAMPPEVRAEVERRELEAQRESWIRAMAPCEHGVADFEECAKCRGDADA
jgi:hypothetical protein